MMTQVNKRHDTPAEAKPTERQALDRLRHDLIAWLMSKHELETVEARLCPETGELRAELAYLVDRVDPTFGGEYPAGPRIRLMLTTERF